eukprot:3971126-Heterocapsa_arctica.AAC.1
MEEFSIADSDDDDDDALARSSTIEHVESFDDELRVEFLEAEDAAVRLHSAGSRLLLQACVANPCNSRASNASQRSARSSASVPTRPLPRQGDRLCRRLTAPEVPVPVPVLLTNTAVF